MTRASLISETRPLRGGPMALVCVQRSSNRALAQRLAVLIGPRAGGVHISDDPEDIMTPSVALLMNGWGALEPFAALRECQLKFATPAIVVVNQGNGAMILALLRAGATDCVRWPAPFADAELLARVEARLTRPAENVRLDGASLMLTCGDVVARLTLLEFRVVHHLLQNAARWSTAEEMTTIALRAGHGSQGVLRVRIHAIRRKLEQESWRLRSDRKLGYRFDIRASQTVGLTTTRALLNDERESKS